MSKTFGELQIGDNIYVIDHESHSFLPMIGKIKKITKTYQERDYGAGKHIHFEMEMDTDLGTIIPELDSESDTISWDGDMYYDVYADKEEFQHRLMEKIEELTTFCLKEL